jgi:small-conductance mechanosensitive channel
MGGDMTEAILQALQALQATLQAQLTHTTQAELLLFGAHLTLTVFLRVIFRWVRRLQGLPSTEEREEHLFTLIQRVNIAALSLVTLNVLLLPMSDHSWFTKALSALLVVSGAYLSDSVADVLILRRFGRARTNELSEQTYAETYQSRLISLITTALISVIALLTLVRLFGFESALEAGGVIGFLGVLLALTQGSWAPDMISGLIILNAKLIDEGDVILLESEGELLAVVFKTKLFHTELLSLTNNHRVMIPNARLRAMTIQNLSKFASARGLRESMSFKIGYDTPSTKIKALFEGAFQEACEVAQLPLLTQHPLEIHVVDTGDFAVTWRIFYYTKDVKQLLKTRQLFLELIHERALREGISLATPVLYERVESAQKKAHTLLIEHRERVEGKA